ncbi:hypothetical protein Pmani_027330 [Petrolisthes manimaculis]|uniref:Uncharacterized protein n=1 Tax=Petrolisthes manimaculis TaxID=1843537 RepID=A0AAE1TVU6_9EUCA|nr:hypothetical protein Pmani_027330 [Petrolisthes manimaculis]
MTITAATVAGTAGLTKYSTSITSSTSGDTSSPAGVNITSITVPFPNATVANVTARDIIHAGNDSSTADAAKTITSAAATTTAAATCLDAFHEPRYVPRTDASKLEAPFLSKVFYISHIAIF